MNFFSGQSNTKGKWPIIVPFEYKIKDRACLIYEKARARRNGAKMTGAVNRYYVTKSKNDGIMILDFFFAYMVKGLPNMSIITS